MASTLNDLRRIGRRPETIHIVPTRDQVRPAYVHPTDPDAAQLLTRPLASPTGPGGAPGFHNVAGSQIAQPEVTNIYMGPFWGDQAVLEGFSKAIVENGYLDPLRELNYGTGSGTYLGMVSGPTLASGSMFTDAAARAAVTRLLDAKAITADASSLFMLILPAGVTSSFPDGSQSCKDYCGYHDAVPYQELEVAYGVLPSSQCSGCGGQFADFTAVYAHELAEACTDKVPGQGWVANDGEENGDLEAWVLLGWGPPSDPNRYTIQGYYTNERGNTVGAWRDTTSSSG